MTRDFTAIFRGIPPLMREQLPAELGAFQWQAWSGMAKAWYGNRALHYEIWVRSSQKVVELGLHFEADELTNARLYGAFRGRAKEIAHALGRAARVETWDRGWSRVWEPIALDDVEAEPLRSRFVAYVRTLEPMLREELPTDVRWRIAKPRRASAATRSARGSGSRASRSAR